MKWDDVRQEFEWDGSLRDIYALDANPSGWRAFWRLVQGPAYRVAYKVDGKAEDLPGDVETAFQLRATAVPLLSVYLGSIQLNCHFFNDSDIELDLDPREVTGQAHLDAVLAFMRNLGRTTSTNVVLTPDSQLTLPIIRYEVDSDSFVHVPPRPIPR